jgi:predicted transcriptional regulator
VSARPALVKLTELTNALLFAVESADARACSELLRERDEAISGLAREIDRKPTQAAERELLAHLARASARVEERLVARVAEVASELRAVREARSSLPRDFDSRGRSLGRV